MSKFKFVNSNVPKLYYLSLNTKKIKINKTAERLEFVNNKRRLKKTRGPSGLLIKMKRINYIKPFKKINNWNKKLSCWYGYIPRKTYKKLKEKITLKKPFFTWLERRLDVLLVRLELARSIDEARQLIRHGHIVVNHKVQRRPGLFVPIGSYIESTHPLSGLMRYSYLSYYKRYRGGGLGKPAYLGCIGINGGILLRHPNKQEVCLPRFRAFGDYVLNKKSKNR